MASTEIFKRTFTFIKGILSHLHVFRRPLLYKIALIDLIFLSLMLIIGKIFSIVPTASYEQKLSSIVLVFFLSFGVICGVYLSLKKLFYKLIRKETSLFRLILNQTTALVVIYLVLNLVYFLLRKIILKIILPEHSDLLKVILLTILITIGYILFLCVQKHDHERFIEMLKNSFKELAVKRNYSFFIYDILLLLPGYLLYILLTWIHQVLLVYLKLPMELLNISFDYSTNFLALILIALVMAINKFMIFDLENKTHHVKEESQNA